MSSSVAPTKQILMSDMFRANEKVGQRSFKVSSEPWQVGAALSDKAHSLSGSYSIQAGNTLVFNIVPASSIAIKKIVTNSGLMIALYDQHGTGSADGIVLSSNLNICSADESPTQGQIYYGATVQGKIIDAGIGILETGVLACLGDQPSFAIKNTTGTTQLITFTCLFEEIGERESGFGLTASTLLQPNTEMADYG